MKNHTEILLATPSMYQSRDLLIYVLLPGDDHRDITDRGDKPA